MSERGSFITEYVYCDKCFEALKSILIDKDKYLWSTVIGDYPIIAGKIGGGFAGEERVMFMHNYGFNIEQLICHDVRIAVLAEDGEKVFILKAKGKK